MNRSIKSIVLGTALAVLVGATSASADVVKTVTVKHYGPGYHRVVVGHPYYRHHYHRHVYWRHGHRYYRWY